MDITDTVAAFSGVGPSLLDTCRVAAQKTAPTKKKQAKAPAIEVAVVATMNLRDRFRVLCSFVSTARRENRFSPVLNSIVNRTESDALRWQCSKLMKDETGVHIVTPTLLIHGIFDTDALFQKMRYHLQLHGRDVHCLNLTPNNGDVGLDELAQQIVNYVDSRFDTGETIDLVGFSMGGLVARYYVQRLGGLERVRRFITISSPHNGTCTAFLRWNKGVRRNASGKLVSP